MRLSDVELKHLHSFLAVADQQSFGRAAQRLGYTQSAVSQQIASLEKALATALFIRPGGPRPIELTEAGRLLLGHATSIIEQLDQVRVDFEGLRDGTRGRLAVGAFQSVSVRLLPRVVRLLAAERPDLEFELFEEDVVLELIGRMERRELDAFFADGTYDHRFRQIELFEDPYLAVLPLGTVERGESIAVNDLAAMPIIGHHERDVCRVRVDAAVRAQGFELDHVFLSSDNATLQAMVRAGRGAAIMPRLSIELDDDEVVFAPVDPPLPSRTITLIWRDEPDVPPAMNRFVELATEVGEQINATAHRKARAAGVPVTQGV